MTGKPLRVAVLVHNDVVRDARVRKEVRTLTESGHVVDVYGFRRERDDYPDTIEGARRLVLVDDLVSLARHNRWLRWLPGRTRRKRLTAMVLPNIALLLALSLFAAVRRVAPDVLVIFLVWVGFTGIQRATNFRRKVMRKSEAVFDRSNRHLRKLRQWQSRKPKERNVLAWRYRQMATALAHRISAGDYDVIHAHDMIALIAARRLKDEGARARLVWDAHELYEHVTYAYSGASKFVTQEIRAAAPRIDSFVTISESFSEYYAKRHRLPPAKVVMNATRHTGTPHDDGRLHRAARLSPDRRILLFQGGLSPHRGIEALLAAAPDLPSDWSLVLMGWGKLQPDVEAAREALAQEGRPDAIALIPPAPQEELTAWTAGASLGAIPYENTNLNHLYCTPNKLWEYPNAGVPIVATDLVEMGRMIREWGTGLLLPREFAPSDIVVAVRSYDPATERRLRENCARFSRQMSWSRFEPALLKAYDEVA